MQSRLLIALALCSVAGLTGCVERKVTIASDPPGALVYVNDVEVGRTPVTVPILWYGDYDVRARLDKNLGTADEPKVTQYYYHGSRTAKAPVYEWIPLDLFAELLPIPFKDEKIWAVQLKPADQPSDDDMVKRAQELKDRLNSDTGVKRPKDIEPQAPASRKAPAPASAPTATTQSK